MRRAPYASEPAHQIGCALAQVSDRGGEPSAPISPKVSRYTVPLQVARVVLGRPRSGLAESSCLSVPGPGARDGPWPRNARCGSGRAHRVWIVPASARTALSTLCVFPAAKMVCIFQIMKPKDVAAEGLAASGGGRRIRFDCKELSGCAAGELSMLRQLGRNAI